MPEKKANVEYQLEKKLGCEKHNSNHIFFKFYYDGKIIWTFKVSHSKGKYKEIDDSGLSAMVRGLNGVTTSFFKQFLACDVTKAEMVARITDSIPSNP